MNLLLYSILVRIILQLGVETVDSKVKIAIRGSALRGYKSDTHVLEEKQGKSWWTSTAKADKKGKGNSSMRARRKKSSKRGSKYKNSKGSHSRRPLLFRLWTDTTFHLGRLRHSMDGFIFHIQGLWARRKLLGEFIELKVRGWFYKRKLLDSPSFRHTLALLPRYSSLLH
jgi:hypothetical protein